MKPHEILSYEMYLQKISINDLASQLNMTEKQVFDMTQGSTPIPEEKLFSLCDAISIDPEWLCGKLSDLEGNCLNLPK